jgi:hypothetical protein
MKTAMQLLLKEVTQARDISVDVNFRSALDFVRDTIEWDYIEKEKEQMIDFAFKYGDLTTREIADSFDKEYKTYEK